jgi:ribulose-5-phosphate 4-epimerase/fuculose-1-phosphate aldolase
MLLYELRKKVLDTALSLPSYGLVWLAGGTVSARDPETNLVCTTPSGLDYRTLSAEDICVTDIDEKIVDSKYRPSVALTLWTNFFRKRPDVNAVVHTHSHAATAFAVTGQEMPIITETQANWFNRPIPITPYLSVEDPRFDMLPVELTADGFAVMLGQHGVITLGSNLDHALERAVTLEEAAKTYAYAKIFGTPRTLPPEVVRRSFDYYHNRYGQNADTEGEK